MEFCVGWICCRFVSSDHRHCMAPSRVCNQTSWRYRKWSCKCFFQMHWWCSWHPWIVCSELTYWLNHKSMHKPQIYRVRGPLCNAKSEGWIKDAEKMFCQSLSSLHWWYRRHPLIGVGIYTHWLVCNSVGYLPQSLIQGFHINDHSAVRY